MISHRVGGSGRRRRWVDRELRLRVEAVRPAAPVDPWLHAHAQEDERTDQEQSEDDPVVPESHGRAADGTGDVCDCAPQDATAQALPPLLQDLVLTGMSPTLLTWPDPGAGLRFDVVSGLLSELRGDAGLDSAICIADDTPGASYQDNRPSPAAGSTPSIVPWS